MRCSKHLVSFLAGRKGQEKNLKLKRFISIDRHQLICVCFVYYFVKYPYIHRVHIVQKQKFLNKDFLYCPQFLLPVELVRLSWVLPYIFISRRIFHAFVFIDSLWAPSQGHSSIQQLFISSKINYTKLNGRSPEIKSFRQ